jgi:hypothetical protein
MTEITIEQKHKAAILASTTFSPGSKVRFVLKAIAEDYAAIREQSREPVAEPELRARVQAAIDGIPPKFLLPTEAASAIEAIQAALDAAPADRDIGIPISADDWRSRWEDKTRGGKSWQYIGPMPGGDEHVIFLRDVGNRLQRVRDADGRMFDAETHPFDLIPRRPPAPPVSDEDVTRACEAYWSASSFGAGIRAVLAADRAAREGR